MALANHLVYDLLETADHLARQPGRPNLTKTYKRRAISTAYYAVFQAVCSVFADVVIGWGSDPELLDPVFRSVDHASARNRLSSSDDEALNQLGVILGRLQSKRHDADYLPPRYQPTEKETLDVIQQAREAIVLIESLDERQRKAFAVSLTGRGR